MWDLVPGPRIEPGPPALGVQSLTHWTTREVPRFITLSPGFFIFEVGIVVSIFLSLHNFMKTPIKCFLTESLRWEVW